jgi:hypothetical protein
MTATPSTDEAQALRLDIPDPDTLTTSTASSRC